MITEIPTAEDFESAGISMLNLAWDAVFDLEDMFKAAEFETWDDDGKEAKHYWSSAQQTLGSAQALVQQGVELLLKSRVVEVSPYLLLDRNVRDWPKKNENTEIKFSEFKTIDAQDLSRVLSIVGNKPMDSSFLTLLEESRKKRNTFIHSIDKSMSFIPREILTTILEVAHHLVGARKWISLRRHYLERAPRSMAFSEDGVLYILSTEISQLLGWMEPSATLKYIGTNKSDRKYICVNCAIDSSDFTDERPKTALLKPNAPITKNVHCFICDENHIVQRIKCISSTCKGNVLSESLNVCLTCYMSQDQCED